MQHDICKYAFGPTRCCIQLFPFLHAPIKIAVRWAAQLPKKNQDWRTNQTSFILFLMISAITTLYKVFPFPPIKYLHLPKKFYLKLHLYKKQLCKIFF